jgi:GTP-binding protein Era
MDANFKSGYIALIGKPNVGKSTLLNRLVGEKLAIVSEKPQTTRDKILGILTTETYQMVFVDTPGVIVPRDTFNQCLVDRALSALQEVDLVHFLIEANDPDPAPEGLEAAFEKISCPKFLAVNKVDLITMPFDMADYKFPIARSLYAEVIPISALMNYNLDLLIARTLEYLPIGPLYYEPDQLSDRDQRFLVAEIVREKVFNLTGQEIPYAVATEVDEFKERETGKYFIRIVVYIERDSQKGIVIGKGGQLIKKIGQYAREEIEQLLGVPVYLELRVKVRKNWRKNEHELRRLGYLTKKKSS